MPFTIRYRGRSYGTYETREAASARRDELLADVRRRASLRAARRASTADVEEHVCRATGATIRIQDSWSSLTEFEPERDPDTGKRNPGARWLTLCDTHATICSHPSLRLARQHAAWPEWCESCQTILATRSAASRG